MFSARVGWGPSTLRASTKHLSILLYKYKNTKIKIHKYPKIHLLIHSCTNGGAAARWSSEFWKYKYENKYKYNQNTNTNVGRYSTIIIDTKCCYSVLYLILQSSQFYVVCRAHSEGHSAQTKIHNSTKTHIHTKAQIEKHTNTNTLLQIQSPPCSHTHTHFKGQEAQRLIFFRTTHPSPWSTWSTQGNFCKKIDTFF